MLVDVGPMVTNCSFLEFFFVFFNFLIFLIFLFGLFCNFFLEFNHGKVDQKI